MIVEIRLEYDMTCIDKACTIDRNRKQQENMTARGKKV